MSEPTRTDDAPTPPAAGTRPPRAGPLAVARAVLWSFLGIRRGRDLAQDVASITPLQVVIGGLVGAAVLVVSLLLLVRWIVAGAA